MTATIALDAIASNKYPILSSSALFSFHDTPPGPSRQPARLSAASPNTKATGTHAPAVALSLLQHIFNKDSVAHSQIVDHVGHCAISFLFQIIRKPNLYNCHYMPHSSVEHALYHKITNCAILCLMVYF